MHFLRSNNLKIACTRIELVDENLVIDLIENQKLPYELANSVLKERLPGGCGLSSWSLRRVCRESCISSRVSTKKVIEMMMEASNKAISAF